MKILINWYNNKIIIIQIILKNNPVPPRASVRGSWRRSSMTSSWGRARLPGRSSTPPSRTSNRRMWPALCCTSSTALHMSRCGCALFFSVDVLCSSVRMCFVFQSFRCGNSLFFNRFDVEILCFFNRFDGEILCFSIDSMWKFFVFQSFLMWKSSDRGSGRRPLFQLNAALPACAYIRGAEWPIFIITFWVVTITVVWPNLVYA